MKKSYLILISSIVLFSIINITLAQAGCVTIKVHFSDGCYVESATVIATQTTPEEGIFLGYTDINGKVERCDLLVPGEYSAIAYYPPPSNPWFQESYLLVNEVGDGSATITGSYGCPSGYCVDGFCCNSACGGECEACNIVGHEGTCTNIPSGQDPDNECIATSCLDSCDIDSNLYTWDYANDVPNYCSGSGSCTSNLCSYNHACADADYTDGVFLWESLIRGCNAGCDEQSDCPGHVCMVNCFCSESCADADADGYGVCPDCNIANGCMSDGNDCNDADYNIHPGAVENCADEKDNDCNTCTDTADYKCGGIETSCSDGIDNDCNGCSDGADFRCGGTDITCNNYDDDCDGAIDEDYVSISCGAGNCIGTTSCVNGEIICSTSGNPCNDGLYCTVNDVCTNGICGGSGRDCSTNNLQGIATCDWNPDNYHPTWDFRNSFTSTCDEVYDICTTGDSTITHTCNKQTCGGCEKNSDCPTGQVCRSDCTCGVWESIYTGSGGYPIIDIEEYNSKLYSASNGVNIYVYDGSIWSTITSPVTVSTLQSFNSKLYVAGSGGKIYSYDGSTFNQVFDTGSQYAKMLGVYNGKLYAGTYLAKPAKLYYSPDGNSWYPDTTFNSMTPCSGPFCSIDSMAVYNEKMYLTSGGTIYLYDGSSWSIISPYTYQNLQYIASVNDMKVYSGKLYLATRDASSKCPIYAGGSGFCGRVIEYDGTNWNTKFDYSYPTYTNGYWIYSLESYNGRLYVGTANRIYTYDGNTWELTYSATSGAQYALVMKAWNGKIYAGFGNGLIAKDDMLEPLNLKILSPANTTYTTSVPLTFTINRPVSWIGYSLDGKPNVTIKTNTTLVALANGGHNIMLYVSEAIGKTNTSKVYFTVSVPTLTCTCTNWLLDDTGCCRTRICKPKGCALEKSCNKICIL